MSARLEIAPGCFVDAARQTLPLTERQERLWRFIKSCHRSPSFDEMLEHMGLQSKSGICRMIDALEAKGYARRSKYRVRSVVAVDPATDLSRFSTAELASELARRLAG